MVEVQGQVENNQTQESVDITISAVNDDVTATNTAQTLSVNEDSTANDLDDIVLSDPDAADASPDSYTISLTLSDTAAGSLSADSGSGESFSSGVLVHDICNLGRCKYCSGSNDIYSNN